MREPPRDQDEEEIDKEEMLDATVLDCSIINDSNSTIILQHQTSAAHGGSARSRLLEEIKEEDSK